MCRVKWDHDGKTGTSADVNASTFAERIEARLRTLAVKGLNQIGSQAYDRNAPATGSLRWGVAFLGKHVAGTCERLPQR